MATTLTDLKTYLKITDTSEDDLLSLLLSSAEKKVLKRRYPFGYTEENAELALEEFSDTVLDIAVYLYNRQGSEGQTSHSETGMSRGYESSGVPDSYLQNIIPMSRWL